MKKTVLSNRLQAIAKMVTMGNTVADVGTDHGFVPLFLLENGYIPSAIAMDINKGPLEKAKRNFEKKGVEGVEYRLSDGLDKLMPHEVESIVICGMGGLLIKQILEKGYDVWQSCHEVILSPQSDIGCVRKYVLENGFCITKERMIYEEDKFYTIIKAKRGNEQTLYSPMEYQFGRMIEKGDEGIRNHFIRSEQNKLLRAYIHVQEEMISLLSNALVDQERLTKMTTRKHELAEELVFIEEFFRRTD